MIHLALLAIPLNRARGEEGYAFIGRAGLALLAALPVLTHSLWLASLVLVFSFWGIVVSHNRYYDLKTRWQYVGLALTGLAYTLPASLSHLYIGNYYTALAFALAGLLKPLAYKLSLIYNNILGVNRDHLPYAEWFFGVIICLGLIPSYWGL